MKRRYSEKQLDLLRDGVLAYRLAGESDGGEPYSWNSISEAIREKTGVEIPYKNLSKFVQGIPARGKGKSEREYPKELANNGIKHILDFLSDETDGFAILSKSEFENEARETKWPDHLQAYLNSGEVGSTIDLKAMAGKYYTRNIEENYVLNVVPNSKNKKMTFRVTSQEKDEEYNGWLVSSMQDHILLIGQDIHDPDNYLIYFLVGIENNIRRGQRPIMICFLKYGCPEDRYDLPDEYNFFMSSIVEETTNNLHVYCEYPKTKFS